MSLSKAQTARYWREWKSVCLVQGWKGNDSERRYSLHAAAGSRPNDLPRSMKDFTNRDFDKYLAHCAALQNRVDIRDRERERVEISIERLNEALRLITGRDFVQGIVRDMNDRESIHDLPLDPIGDQVERGAAVANPEKYAGRRRGRGRFGYDGAHSDLDNLRNTLSNRLSKLLSRIKGTGSERTNKAGRIECPPELEWVRPVSNNAAIEAITAGKIAIRQSNGRTVWYLLATPAEYARFQRTGKAPAAPVQEASPVEAEPEPHDAYEPIAKPSPILAIAGYVPPEDDAEMPF